MEKSEDTEFCFPHLLNASCVKSKRPQYETTLTYILVLSISLLTVTLNLLVIISISHFKQLHTPSNLLLLSLAVSDFIVGLLMLFQIELIDGCWLLGDIMCSLYLYLVYIITAASLGTMVLISVDRYVAICYPLHYSTKVTQQKVKIFISLCWLFSVMYQGMNVKDNLQQPGRFNSCFGECIIAFNCIARITDLVVSFIVPITVIVVLYVRVFVVAVSQAHAVRSHIAVVSLAPRSLKVTAKRSELKAARTLGVLIGVFLMCLLPYYCISLSGNDKIFETPAAAVVIYFYYFNSCINPAIYAFFYSWFRKSVKLIVTLKILQPDSCEVNMQ
ncbi:trace amine-associated receptor 13c-like [Betta splendens]|uniref:Trace amine-associated receptor 13c-like n=1 Tax=Betta splendens TaxID=158456 RepID=A0A8M1H8R3_BETSP|nr:trace amine-associated receptor 13c-like [Betta splendens]